MDVGEPTDHFVMLEMFTKEKDSTEFALKGFYMIKMDPSKEVTIVIGLVNPGSRKKFKYNDQ